MKVFPAIAAGVLAAATLTALPALASAQDAAAQPSHAAKKKNDSNRLICKTTEVTGTRLGGHQTCLTRAQWNDQTEETQQYFQALPSTGLNGSGSMGH